MRTTKVSARPGAQYMLHCHNLNALRMEYTDLKSVHIDQHWHHFLLLTHLRYRGVLFVPATVMRSLVVNSRPRANVVAARFSPVTELTFNTRACDPLPALPQHYHALAVQRSSEV
jgi:hypothetical protein